jgi:NAD(P)-dependent dehydrogenase (short-subunit alcohol dehydrogenase family)
MANRIAGKIAIVTGAGTSGEGMGNGKAAALLFAWEGASISAVDMNEEAARKTADEIVAEGSPAVAIAADVSRSEDVQRIVNRTIDQFGRIDIIHNNVGIEIAGDPITTSEEDWDRVHAVNLKSVFMMCKYAIPHMERQGGSAIVNVSSVASIRWSPVPYFSYHTSKAALNQMTRVIARQYAPKNIRCNVLLLGMMDTPHIRTYYRDLPSDEVDRIMRRRDEHCPMGHMGNAWDAAHAALFLVSDEARYITGAELIVDGGLTL